MKYLPLIWSGMWRKRGRAILILLQIAIAFMLFGLLQGMQSGMAAVVEGIDADVFVVSRATGDGPLPLAHMGRIQALDDVLWIQRQSFLVGTYQKPNQMVWAIAIDVPVWVKQGKADLRVPADGVAAMAQMRDGVLVGRKLADKYGWKVGDRIPIQGGHVQKNASRDWNLQVVGIYDDPAAFGYSNVMVMNWDYLNQARAEEQDTVGRYIIRVRDVTQGLATAQRIDGLFANSSDETRTESLAESAQNTIQSAGDLNFIVRAVVGAVMFALLFSVAAMMMQSTRERTPELAVLRTLGFSDARVFWILVLEAVILCVVAAAVGLLLAARILPLAEAQLGVGIRMPGSVASLGFAITLVLAVAASAPPAWRCLRLGVADALSGR